MDINIFDEKPKSDVKEVFQNTDGDRFQKIVEALCNKRKSLEDNIEKEKPNTSNEETLQLQDLVLEMKTFGISEIDYQKWLVLKIKAGN